MNLNLQHINWILSFYKLYENPQSTMNNKTNTTQKSAFVDKSFQKEQPGQYDIYVDDHQYSNLNFRVPTFRQENSFLKFSVVLMLASFLGQYYLEPYLIPDFIKFFSALSLFSLALTFVALIQASYRAVNQATAVIVERWGKVHQVLKPGLSFIYPVMDNVVAIVPLSELCVSIPHQFVISKDNATVSTDGVLYFRIIDPVLCIYGVDNLAASITNLAITNIRTVLGSMELDQALSDRVNINFKITQSLNQAVSPWGIEVKRVELKDIEPPVEIKKEMIKQLAAERERRSVVIKGQGERSAAILAAEARKESRLLEASGEAEATKMISSAIAQGDIKSIQYFISKEYISALKDAASSSNTKLMILPVEVTQLLGSVSSIKDLLQFEEAKPASDINTSKHHDTSTEKK